ncbi:RagB/SusD family nutrient uptake outer membrane protein [Maribacter sp. 2307ULW6-5]|uniref:RagB/SusD family nutrient uptake outer membrane protein n=1 Tax=Maribacter sp. 2307ULW6-5 TaxID=3386275 RepID=UPI0039BCC513
MKTNKIITKGIVLILVAIITGACEDYLEKEPIDVIVADNFYSNEEQVFQALVGVYDAMQTRAMYDLNMWRMVDGPTDNLRGNTGARELAEYAASTTDRTLLSTWRGLYDGINRANLLLENIPNAQGLDPEILNRFEGEAKFLRALFYFNLVNLWGEVPLVSEVLPADELTIAPSSVEDVYAFIEQDLKDAIEGLPLNSELGSTDTGRATKGAAQTLLAKTFLYQEKWTDAITFANEVIDSGQYSLQDDFLSIFQESNEFNSEIIFAVVFSPQQGETQLTSQWMEPQGWGQSTPTEDLVEAFEPGDERMNATVIQEGDFMIEPSFEVRSAGYELAPGETISEDFISRNRGETFTKLWWANKFWSRDGWLNNVAAPDNAIDFPVLRYADVILVLAEALAENNDLTGASTELNKIRNRAGLPNVETVIDVSNQAELLDKIYNDRRLEFVNECQRLYDLRRWGIVIDRLNAVEKQAIAPRDLEYPYPQEEVDLHNGTLQQKQGWN